MSYLTQLTTSDPGAASNAASLFTGKVHLALIDWVDANLTTADKPIAERLTQPGAMQRVLSTFVARIAQVGLSLDSSDAAIDTAVASNIRWLKAAFGNPRS